LLRLIDNISDEAKRHSFEEWYYRERRMLLNPEDMLAPGDEGVIITARPKYVEEITKAWVKKFCPNLKLIVLGLRSCPSLQKDIPAWFEEIQMLKIKTIKDEKCDVYIDDNPDVINELRKHSITALQYGGRLPMCL